MDLFRVVPPELEDRHHGFRENTEPQHPPPVNAKPIAYFFKFFTMEFLHHIVRETNKYQINLITEKICFSIFNLDFTKYIEALLAFKRMYMYVKCQTEIKKKQHLSRSSVLTNKQLEDELINFRRLIKILFVF
jgi:hypothetical protein